jgi:hypothetical protein
MKKPPVRVASDVVSAPSGSPWKNARIEVHLETWERPRSGRGGIGSETCWKVSHVLVLTGRDGETKQTFFSTPGRSAGEEETTEAEAQFRLLWSPDTHAVAVSKSGGAWRRIALDIERGILYCEHVESNASNPFSELPDTRTLVLALLQRHPPHEVVEEASEWGAVCSFVERSPGDAELRIAFALASIREATRVDLSAKDQPTRDPVLALATNSEIRAACFEYLKSFPDIADQKGARNAVILLEAQPDASVQRAVADALVRAVRCQNGDRSYKAKTLHGSLARTLMRITEQLRTASPETIEILRSMMSDSLKQGDAVLAFCLRAYLAIEPMQPRGFLEGMAKNSCDACPMSWPTSTKEFESLLEDDGTLYQHNSCCYERGALISKGYTPPPHPLTTEEE